MVSSRKERDFRARFLPQMCSDAVGSSNGYQEVVRREGVERYQGRRAVISALSLSVVSLASSFLSIEFLMKTWLSSLAQLCRDPDFENLVRHSAQVRSDGSTYGKRNIGKAASTKDKKLCRQICDNGRKSESLALY